MSLRSPSRSTSFSRIACVTWRLPLALGYVRKEPEFPGPLYGLGELALVPTAGSGDARGADLPLLAHRPAKRGEVLVVDNVDLVPAELARLAAAAAGRSLAPVPPAARALTPGTLLCPLGRTFLGSFSARLTERGLVPVLAPPPG